MVRVFKLETLNMSLHRIFLTNTKLTVGNPREVLLNKNVLLFRKSLNVVKVNKCIVKFLKKI